jgi:hypothetical protein
MLCSVALPAWSEEARAAAPDGGGSRGGSLRLRCGEDPMRQGCHLPTRGCRTSATRVDGFVAMVTLFIFFLFSARFRMQLHSGDMCTVFPLLINEKSAFAGSFKKKTFFKPRIWFIQITNKLV